MVACPADLSAVEARRRGVDGELTLVDVREDDEWAARHPTGAVHAALSTLPASLSDLPDGPLAFVCRTGNRSAQGGMQAICAGRSSVYCVAGGLEAWEAAGLPVALLGREGAVSDRDRVASAVRKGRRKQNRDCVPQCGVADQG